MMDTPSSLSTTIWFCGQQTSQVQRRGRYTPESNAHPAKMLPELCRQIIQRYTRPGDTILDPFGGVGTTLVEGIHLGRNVILVEYEPRFVKLAEANAKLAVRQGAAGTCTIIRGDSRDLLSLLTSSVDHVISSPPYGDSRLSVEPGIMERLGKALQAGKITNQQYRRFAQRKMFTETPPFSRYSDRPGNIGNRLYQPIDAILTSPPYADSHLRYESDGDKGRTWEVMTRKKVGRYAVPSSDPANLGNLSVYRNVDKSRASSVQSSSPESYLDAVLKVYQGCFSLLKPGGFMILATRNFRRKGRLINLAGDTIRLMELVGFSFYQHNVAVLGSIKIDDTNRPHLVPRSSFWQILSIRKANQQQEPLNLIQHEDVLVFRKP